MTRRPHAASWRPGAATSCLVAAACTVTPPMPVEPPAPTTAMTLGRLAQLGHGREATFELCRSDACPQRTPKTLMAAPGALHPASPTAAAIAPMPARMASEMGDRRLPLAKRPSSAAPQRLPVQQLSVHFPFASAQLDATARATLREAAPRLALAREIALGGRTDSTGPAAVNEALAQARAQAVLRELLILAPGIAPRVSVDAQGVCCFVEPNDSAAGRARNRRVEIRYRPGNDDPP